MTFVSRGFAPAHKGHSVISTKIGFIHLVLLRRYIEKLLLSEIEVFYANFIY